MSIQYEDSLRHEEKRSECLQEMTRKHHQILEAQIQDKVRLKGKKMNSIELLYNKSLIRDLGKENQNVKVSIIPI